MVAYAPSELQGKLSREASKMLHSTKVMYLGRVQVDPLRGKTFAKYGCLQNIPPAITALIEIEISSLLGILNNER